MIYRLASGLVISFERATDDGPLLGYVGDDAVLVIENQDQPRDEIVRELRRVAQMFGRMADDVEAGRFVAEASTCASAPASQR